MSKVYFISDGEGLVKIGKAINVHKRLEDMGNHPNWNILCILLGGYKLEMELHQKFDNEHIKYEWFIESPHILEFIHKEYSQEKMDIDKLEWEAYKSNRNQQKRIKNTPEYNRKRYAMRRQYILDYSKKYYLENKDKISARKKQNYKNKKKRKSI